MAHDLTLFKERTVYALETLKDSWILLIKNFFPVFLSWLVSLAGPVLLLAIGTTIGGLVDHLIMHSRHAGYFTLIGMVIPGFLIGWFWSGWNLICLKVARKLDVRVSDLWARPIEQILSAFVVLVLTTACCGLLGFLIIPGALLFVKWQLAPFYIVDRGYGPIQALKASWRDTDRIFIPLALLDLIFFGLHAVSAIVIVGPFICFLAQAVASAIVYNNWLTDESHPEFNTLAESHPQHLN